MPRPNRCLKGPKDLTETLLFLNHTKETLLAPFTSPPSMIFRRIRKIRKSLKKLENRDLPVPGQYPGPEILNYLLLHLL